MIIQITWPLFEATSEFGHASPRYRRTFSRWYLYCVLFHPYIIHICSGGEQISRLVGYIGGKNKPMSNNNNMGMNRFMFDEKLQDPTKDINGKE